MPRNKLSLIPSLFKVMTVGMGFACMGYLGLLEVMGLPRKFLSRILEVSALQYLRTRHLKYIGYLNCTFCVPPFSLLATKSSPRRRGAAVTYNYSVYQFTSYSCPSANFHCIWPSLPSFLFLLFAFQNPAYEQVHVDRYHCI